MEVKSISPINLIIPVNSLSSIPSISIPSRFHLAFLHPPRRCCSLRARRKSSDSEPVLKPCLVKEISMEDDEEDEEEEENELNFDEFEDDTLMEREDDKFEDEFLEEGEDDEFKDENLEEEEDEDEDEKELHVGDGGEGGIALAGTWWGKEALEIAEAACRSFDGEIGIYAFRTLPNSTIRVRIGRLTDKSNSPDLEDLEAFSTTYRKLLDEAELAKTIPEDITLESTIKPRIREDQVGRRKMETHHRLGLAGMATAASSSSLATPIVWSRLRRSPIITNTKLATTAITPTHQAANPLVVRRQLVLKGLALTCPLLLANQMLLPPRQAEAREVEVGSFLPTSPTDPSYVVFKASPKDTPALRAGNVQPYTFILPPSWKQQRIANILSGNYCQPKCAEPWVEVKFENEKQGKVQVVASPLIRLTNKPNATIEDIGTPEKLIASLGPFVTGNSYDPDELLESSVEKHGDQTYYKYYLETPYALTGTHNLAKATAKGSTVVLVVASANDKQWQTSEKVLKAILDSFEV